VLTRNPEEGGISYSRFVQLVRTAARERAREERSEWERAAFVGWQNARTWGYEGSLNEWLEGVGLRSPPAVEDVTAAEADAIGERIRQLDKHTA
jgi:hypothetical protein